MNVLRSHLESSTILSESGNSGRMPEKSYITAYRNKTMPMRFTVVHDCTLTTHHKGNGLSKASTPQNEEDVFEWKTH